MLAAQVEVDCISSFSSLATWVAMPQHSDAP
jgi:hypothetical protein